MSSGAQSPSDALNRPRQPLQIAIETTGRVGSLALLRGAEIRNQIRLPSDATTTSSIASALGQLLAEVRTGSLGLDFVTVAAGPGSFTGVRIGMTAAKALSYGLGLRLATVDSLAAIAATVAFDYPHVRDLLVGLNAYRGEVFAASFAPSWFASLPHQNHGRPLDEASGQLAPVRSEIVAQEIWNQRLIDLPPNRFVAGDVTLLRSISPERVATRRSADGVGTAILGLACARTGSWTDPMSAVPNYLRASAAEEKARARDRE